MSKPKSSHRVFSRAFKLGIVNRMLAGEKMRALARELQFSSKDLYIWRDRFLCGPKKIKFDLLLADLALQCGNAPVRLVQFALRTGRTRPAAPTRSRPL